ncbi:Protein-disulfide isomerase [Shimia gijangensis]|uniref:Protein-disulfide isomerase n=1 Tax=Shimia gijangensis TaxID=1470563 RepID=A0A1M6NQ17_9RHOB|nr:DsbA family protein [Shimia gijangensis]SHJ97813.1 Protein-disulfide isomerase [Shimia gijangensis]
MNRIVPVIVVVLAIVAGGAWWFTQGDEAPAPGQTQTEQTADDGAGAAESGVTEMVMGSPDAPITLIEYASFTCPHCANFHEAVLKPLKADYVDTGKVKVIFRDVYFDKIGLWASMVARCGGEERFWGMTDLLMKGQRSWTQSGDPVTIAGELNKVGRLAGLGDDQLKACMKDEDKAKSLVAWSEANMTKHEITGTPSLIINGEKYSNQSYADLKKVLDAKLGG